MKKGEKALQLSMPVSFKDKKDDTKVVQMFLLKNNWFALSQTDGGEYTPPIVIPEWDKQLALSTLGIEEVRYESTDGNCQGYASDNTIAINPVAIFTTQDYIPRDCTRSTWAYQGVCDARHQYNPEGHPRG